MKYFIIFFNYPSHPTVN